MSQAKPDAYATVLTGDYGFETVCVAARHAYCLRQLRKFQPQSIVEIGCGPELLVERCNATNLAFERWTVIEPAQAFAAHCRQKIAHDPRATVIEAFVESVKPGECTQADLVVLSSVLHEVPNAPGVLRASLDLLKPGGWLVVTVPNALSFHRLLACEMGLIDDPHALSERNGLLDQRRVLDRRSLRDLLLDAGLSELASEGYLFKPFTHTQMWQHDLIGDPAFLRGLDQLGQKFPEHAAEIGCVGRKAPARSLSAE